MGVVATVPTEEITPGVVWLLGRVMVTLSPTATSDCSEASRAMLTWRCVEVAASTGWPGWSRSAQGGRHRGHPRPRWADEHGLSQRQGAVLGLAQGGLKLLHAHLGPVGERSCAPTGCSVLVA